LVTGWSTRVERSITCTNASCTNRPAMCALNRLLLLYCFKPAQQDSLTVTSWTVLTCKRKPWLQKTINPEWETEEEKTLSPWRDRFNSPFPSTLTVSVVPLWHDWPFRLLWCARTAPCQAEKATPCLRNQAAILPTNINCMLKKLHNFFALLH